MSGYRESPRRGKDGAESVNETEIGKTNQLLGSACSPIPVILRMRTNARFSHLSVSRPPFFFFFLHALVGDHGMH